MKGLGKTPAYWLTGNELGRLGLLGLKLTGVVVTHDLDLMYKVADRVVFLYEGHVIFFGPAADLVKSDHPHIHEFLELDRVVKV